MPPIKLDSLEFLIVRLVQAEPSEIHLSELRFSSLGTISRRMFWSGLVILWAVILSVCLYLFSLGDRGLPCNLTSLLDINRVVDFQLVQRFPCKFLHAVLEPKSPVLPSMGKELFEQSCLTSPSCTFTEAPQCFMCSPTWAPWRLNSKQHRKKDLVVDTFQNRLFDL